MRTRAVPAGTDEGFTLVELLVVLVVVGILAAVAVPVYAGQRQKAHDAALQTDLRSIASYEESHYVEHEEYLAVAATSTPVIVEDVRLSPGASASVDLNAAGTAYCIRIDSARATGPRVHVSNRGGLQSRATTTCPAAGTW
ncbi:type IV pilin protein [Kineococcus sp. SYSU DK004]|uniref:type IV pilin protein n=1 Tax=Kineococcus sp. SYSU DK004 TaxID=3383125 RepID=UPI003D7CF3F3